MKTLAIFVLAAALYIPQASAQKNWFSTYNDSTELLNDALLISNQFVKDVNKLDDAIKFSPKTIVHTTPYMIFFSTTDSTAHLPLWSQIIPPLKDFFITSAEMKKMEKNYLDFSSMVFICPMN